MAIKFAIKLNRNKKFLACQGATLGGETEDLDKAELFDTIEQANRRRGALNTEWVARGEIVCVHGEQSFKPSHIGEAL